MAWIYDDAVHKQIKDPNYCIYCGTRLKDLKVPNDRGFHPDERYVKRCPVCGWWQVERLVDTPSLRHTDTYTAYGRLKAFDLSDISAPIDEVRSYLAAKYECRYSINPFLYEQTVASVFRDLGYYARVTTPSGDWGVDVYLDGPDGSLVGVQVKRWKQAINVEQVIALTGALVINECTRGVFVTTSRFRSGAVEAASRSSTHGFPIELVDAKRFYEILQIAQATIEVVPDDPAMPWNRIEPGFHLGKH